MNVEKKLKELNLELPSPPKPAGAYLPYRKTGNLIYISGQGCRVNGELKYQGKVGKDLNIEEAYDAARICCINALSILKGAVGDLDKVVKIVNVHGFVNSAEGFTDQAKVVNGASDFLIKVFGDNGRHSRCALAACELPNNIPVELEMIVEVNE
jgi:enamine deaminase RidA (YjgF/YER057c/UK114 family)